MNGRGGRLPPADGSMEACLVRVPATLILAEETPRGDLREARGDQGGIGRDRRSAGKQAARLCT